MSWRDDVAAALSTVPGVKGYRTRPAAIREGDGWPLLTGLERAEGWAFYNVQRVVVLLPQDEEAASDWIDAKWEALLDALEPIGYVERFDPITLPVGSSEQFALQITMRSE